VARRKPLVRWQPAGKDVSMKVEDTVGICRQATPSEDRRLSACYSELQIRQISDSAVVTCNYKS
jgi:hypothetical protein